GANLVGESGDVYLVNADGLLYTDTLRGRFAQDAAFKERLNTVAYENMASHIARGDDNYAGTGLYEDYDGFPVIGAYGVLNIGNTPLGIIVEIDQGEGLADVNSLILYIVIITTITVAIAFALIFFGSGSITRPIKYLKETLNKLADKDFTVSVDYDSKDELGDVSKNLNRTIKDLRNSLIRVNESSNFVSSSTDEISVGNQDLSQRTQEQASSVEEISSTIEEISSSIKQVANSSLEGEKLAGKTLEVVEEGQGAVLETKNSMENISESSEKIAAIISTVNDIAFQTNLLALNAAVEAARAGEQGRGFAVVAAEVRNLAGRTAESAKEIEDLISTSVERIKVGNEKVERAAAILEEIVSNTENTNDVVSEIAAAMREQATATDQITSTVENLNQVTQQNASMVEEIASSSEAMSSEANNLMDMVGQFYLGEEAVKKAKKTVETKAKSKNKADNINELEEEDDDDFDLNMDEFEKF
ncbi:MAG: methyl-accepting chemotaxis protein, partial [Bacillota bacterium]